MFYNTNKTIEVILLQILFNHEFITAKRDSLPLRPLIQIFQFCIDILVRGGTKIKRQNEGEWERKLERKRNRKRERKRERKSLFKLYSEQCHKIIKRRANTKMNASLHAFFSKWIHIMCRNLSPTICKLVQKNKKPMCILHVHARILQYDDWFL